MLGSFRIAYIITLRDMDAAVVVYQLTEQLLQTPGVRGTNPVIGKFLYRTFVYLLSNVLKRRK